MDKKIIIVVLVAILVGVGIVMYTRQPEEKPPVVTPLPPEEDELDAGVAGYGWSVEDDVRAAAEEAVAGLEEQLEGVTPDWVAIYATVGYDSEVLLSHLKELLGPQVKIWGETVKDGVMTPDGYHVGKKGALALLGVSSPKIKFGVGASNVEEIKEGATREAAKEAILAAIEDAGKQETDRPQVILTAFPFGQEFEVLEAFESVVSEETPMFGGAAADNTFGGTWKMFSTDRVFSSGVVATVIYTDLKMGWVFQHGCQENTGIAHGTVTKAAGHVIYEIDGRPAAEVYNEWVGGALSEKLKTGGNICDGFTCTNPPALVLRDKEGKVTDYYLKGPRTFELPDKSMSFFDVVPEGAELCLLRCYPDMFLNRPKVNAIVARSRAGISEDEVLFAINGQCACAVMTITYWDKDMAKMASSAKEALGDAPFLLSQTFGEFGYKIGVGNQVGNENSWMVVVGKK